MTEQQAEAPVSLKVVGWAWIVVGTLMAFSGIMGSLAFSIVSANAPRQRQTGSAFFDFVFDHFAAIAVVQLVVAVAIIIAAVATLKRRQWGAVVVGASACLGLLYIVAFSAAFLHHVMTLTPTSGDAPVSRAGMGAFFVFGVGFNALFWGTPLVLTLYVLTRPHVRAVLKSRGRPTRS